MKAAAALVVLAACSGAAADPAPEHAVTADSVTAASAAWQPGPPLVTDARDGSAATIDGAALRDRHRARLAADTSPVTMLAGGTPSELGERLCAAVVPKRPAATPILLKPNMGGFNWFHDPKTHHGDDGVKGRITDPEFVRGVVHCLKARGHTTITIADGFTGIPKDWDRLVKLSGYGAMAKEEGVTLVALDDDGVYDAAATPGQPGKPLAISGIGKTHVPTLLMPKLVAETLDHGMFITIPKLKTHRFSVFSLGIKGMQGTAMYSDASPAFRQKWRSHRELDSALAAVKRGDADARSKYVGVLETFAERMVDMIELEAPDVELAEGAPAMDGDGFDELFPRAENVAIGGTNVVTVDRVAAQYLGLWDSAALAKELGGHRTSPLLEAAAKRFGVDLTKTKVIGDGAAILATHQPAHLHGMAGFEIVEKAGKAPAAAPPPSETVPDGATKDLRATKLVGPPPVLDDAIDAAWSAAQPLEFSTDWAGHATKTVTRVRALWSPTAVYFLWELSGTGLHTDHKRDIATERTDLYEEDCVELFLVPDAAKRKRYFEIELGPFGHFFDLLVDWAKQPRGDDKWSAGLHIGTAQDAAAHTAIIEVAVTSPDVVAALAPDARLPLGLYRMEGTAPRSYLAAFPTRTPKPNFHVPDAFGTLILEP